MNTKEKIVHEALNLFSIRGFSSVSVRDISSAVGIKASSLYNHFKNKQDIFDTIVNNSLERISNFSDQINISSVISKVKLEELLGYEFFNVHIGIFKFYLQDDFIVKFRKMLTIEGFNNSKISKLYNKIFIDNIIDAESRIFSMLMNKSIMIKKDPYILALQFYSPIFLLFYRYENITDKELLSLKNHIFEFKDTYMLKG